MTAMEIERLLEICVRKCAAEMHLAVGLPPLIRLGAGCRDLDFRVLSAADTLAAVKLLAPAAVRRHCDAEGSGEFEFVYGSDATFRTVVMSRVGGYAMRLSRRPTGAGGTH